MNSILAMKLLLALAVLFSLAFAFSTPADAYVLSEQECYQGAQISARAADLRDRGTPKEFLIKQTNERKHQYSDIALYEIVLDIVRVVYDIPELSPQQHGDRFLDECVRTKGQMDKKV